jgi:hypothetical protein
MLSLSARIAFVILIALVSRDSIAERWFTVTVDNDGVMYSYDLDSLKTLDHPPKLVSLRVFRSRGDKAVDGGYQNWEFDCYQGAVKLPGVGFVKIESEFNSVRKIMLESFCARANAAGSWVLLATAHSYFHVFL